MSSVYCPGAGLISANHFWNINLEFCLLNILLLYINMETFTTTTRAMFIVWLFKLKIGWQNSRPLWLLEVKDAGVENNTISRIVKQYHSFNKSSGINNLCCKHSVISKPNTIQLYVNISTSDRNRKQKQPR
jgi:hypothetical protein